MCSLLEHGADVTLVDDSGLTPVDVAKTKKVKGTLKQAWTEATQAKVQTNLAPLKNTIDSIGAPNVGSKTNTPSSSPERKKKPGGKGGEVVFDVSILKCSFGKYKRFLCHEAGSS